MAMPSAQGLRTGHVTAGPCRHFHGHDVTGVHPCRTIRCCPHSMARSALDDPLSRCPMSLHSTRKFSCASLVRGAPLRRRPAESEGCRKSWVRFGRRPGIRRHRWDRPQVQSAHDFHTVHGLRCRGRPPELRGHERMWDERYRRTTRCTGSRFSVFLGLEDGIVARRKCVPSLR